jgi:DNA polymerase delta subunit 1
VLTSQGLATFTLADCVQTLLGETIELLAPHHLAALWQQVAEGDGGDGDGGDGGGGDAAASLAAQRAAAVRLAR